ncbi:MAG: alpha/beta hydrolase [Aureispira sp.]|nr:alpha/beta hydrolase [Aureispira sp.]
MKSIKSLFFVPGLGCDRRIFEDLEPLLNHPNLDVQHLEFIEPIHSNERIPEYAQRLKESLPSPEEPCMIIGLSLGGMISVELSRLVNCQQLILISTMKHNSEAPWFFKPLRVVPIYKLVPSWFTRQMVPRLARTMGVSNREDSLRYHAMLKDRTATHLRWARGAAVRWNNEEWPTDYVHIHGTKDHIFKHKKVKPDFTIEGGTHNMVMDRAEEIAAIINSKMGW